MQPKAHMSPTSPRAVDGTSMYKLAQDTCALDVRWQTVFGTASNTVMMTTMALLSGSLALHFDHDCSKTHGIGFMRHLIIR